MSFRPFIWVHTVDGAHSFFSAMAERQVKVLWLPGGFGHQSEAEQLATVQGAIREHYQKTSGRYQGFGDILKYRWVHA